jgi:hypothetical protein
LWLTFGRLSGFCQSATKKLLQAFLKGVAEASSFLDLILTLGKGLANVCSSLSEDVFPLHHLGIPCALVEDFGFQFPNLQVERNAFLKVLLSQVNFCLHLLHSGAHGRELVEHADHCITLPLKGLQLVLGVLPLEMCWDLLHRFCHGDIIIRRIFLWGEGDHRSGVIVHPEVVDVIIRLATPMLLGAACPAASPLLALPVPLLPSCPAWLITFRLKAARRGRWRRWWGLQRMIMRVCWILACVPVTLAVRCRSPCTVVPSSRVVEFLVVLVHRGLVRKAPLRPPLLAG